MNQSIDERIKVGVIVERRTYGRGSNSFRVRGSEKIIEVGEIDLGRPCFRTESGEAYRTVETEGKGFCNSGNAAFWCVIQEDAD